MMIGGLILGVFEDLGNLGSTDKLGTTYDEIEEYLEKQGYNLNELSKILREQRTQQIVTGAGSGKTTAIILKTLADLKTGNSTHKVTIKGMTTEVADRIWISTFLKSGADDLERTFNRKKYEMGITASTDNIVFSTLHAEFKRVLNAMGIQTNILSNQAAMKIMREVTKDFGLGSTKGYPTNEELLSIMAYISAARNRLDPSTFYHEDMEEVGLTKSNLMYVINMYQKLREKYRVVDFEDLQELLYKFACNEETRNVNVTNFIARRYDKIIIDEFQDVSEIQYEILKVYAKGCKSVVAVGDDDQLIYSWRGSNIDIITKRFAEDFKPVVNKLSVNYRCPSNILNPIAKSIVKNKNRYEKPLKSHKDGGKLNCFTYDSTIEMARSVQEQITEDVNNGLSVAVLGRTNASLLPLSVFLDFQSKFNYAIRGTLYDLERVKFKRYWRLAYLFTDSDTYIVDNLKLLAPSEPKYKLKSFSNALRTEGYSLFNFPLQTLRNISGDLASYVYNVTRRLGSEDPIDRLKFTFGYLKAQHVNLEGKITSEEIVSILELLEMIIDQGDCKTIDNFLYEIKYRNQRLHGRAESENLSVQLTTVHDFKGKEADSIYIWKDTNKMFPSERSSGSDFEEERRIHYIAGTRAREKSTILTITGQESPFIDEMGIKPVKYVGEGVKGQLKQVKEGSFNTEKSLFDEIVDESGIDFDFNK